MKESTRRRRQPSAAARNLWFSLVILSTLPVPALRNSRRRRNVMNAQARRNAEREMKQIQDVGWQPCHNRKQSLQKKKRETQKKEEEEEEEEEEGEEEKVGKRRRRWWRSGKKKTQWKTKMASGVDENEEEEATKWNETDDVNRRRRLVALTPPMAIE